MPDLKPGYTVRANIIRRTFDSSMATDKPELLLGQNTNRIGFIVYNQSSNSVYLAYDSRAATSTFYSVQIGGNSSYEPEGAARLYTGEITFNQSVAGDGVLVVTEFVKVKPRGRK